MKFNLRCLDGVATLSVYYESKGARIPNEFIIVGSNVPISCLPGEQVMIATIHPVEHQRAVVAIAYMEEGAILYLDWHHDLLFGGDGTAEMSTISPVSGRIGQAYGDFKRKISWIEVQAGDKRYTSAAHRTNVANYVPDPNLLCRYLAGDVEVDALDEAVKEQKKHEARENREANLHLLLEKWRQKYKDVQSELNIVRASQSVQECEEKIELARRLRALEMEHYQDMTKLQLLEYFVAKLKDRWETSWFRGRAAKRFLASSLPKLEQDITELNIRNSARSFLR